MRQQRQPLLLFRHIVKLFGDMNILFLAHRIPFPPIKGDKIRSFHEIKLLSQKHRISLVCLADDKRDLQYADNLHSYCQSVDVVYLSPIQAKLQALLALFTSRKPLSLPYFFSKTLYSIVQQKLREQQYDIILIFSSSMAQYVTHIHEIPKVMDFVDVDSDKWAQYAKYARFPYSYIYRLESRRLRSYEAFIAKTFQYSIFVSPKEKEDFQKSVGSEARVEAIAHGIDITMFHPSDEPYDPNRLVFTGAMDYFANVETMLYFVREILPLIQQKIPHVILYIVGSKPAPEIIRLGEQYTNIVVTGFVEQIQPYVIQSAVFVAPMRIGRGINNKILEAMAMGVPVITSSLGFEGIPGEPQRDIFVADDPHEFARYTCTLMLNPEQRKAVAIRARKTIEEQCNWEKNIEQLEMLLENVQQESQTYKQ